MASLTLADLCGGLPLDPLPPPQSDRDPSVPHAPPRTPVLTQEEKKVCEICFPVKMMSDVTSKM